MSTSLTVDEGTAAMDDLFPRDEPDSHSAKTMIENLRPRTSAVARAIIGSQDYLAAEARDLPGRYGRGGQRPSRGCRMRPSSTSAAPGPPGPNRSFDSLPRCT